MSKACWWARRSPSTILNRSQRKSPYRRCTPTITSHTRPPISAPNTPLSPLITQLSIFGLPASVSMLNFSPKRASLYFESD